MTQQRLRFCLCAFSVVSLIAPLALLAQQAAPDKPSSGATRTSLPHVIGTQELAFEANQASIAPADVKFLARGRGGSLYLKKGEAVLAVAGSTSSKGRRQSVLGMKFAGSASAATLQAEEQLPGKVYYANAEVNGPLNGNATYRR